jgi:ThiF family
MNYDENGNEENDDNDGEASILSTEAESDTNSLASSLTSVDWTQGRDIISWYAHVRINYVPSEFKRDGSNHRRSESFCVLRDITHTPRMNFKRWGRSVWSSDSSMGTGSSTKVLFLCQSPEIGLIRTSNRMRNATILVVDLRGVATEVIKNIVLAGIGELVILDHEDVTEEDLGAGFFFRDEDVGKKVSKCCFRSLV